MWKASARMKPGNLISPTSVSYTHLDVYKRQVLTGVEGYNMYLPNGVYYFYAISNNSSTASAKFINERSEPLTNGVDYLWASNKLQDVTSTQVSIPIDVYKRQIQAFGGNFEAVIVGGAAFNQEVEQFLKMRCV